MRALIALLIVVLLGYAPAAQAVTDVDLAEYAFNIDGTVSDSLAGDPVPAAVNAAGFDLTTGLGTLTVTVSGAGAHYVGFFVDHEIAQNVNGFSNESGAALGVAGAGQSWEIDEPGWIFGDIFGNFSVSALDESNAVPAGAEDDVSMALAWSFALGAGETAVITFAVGGVDPGGFRLAQTDPDSPYTLYFSGGLRVEGGGGGSTQVPEPGLLLLLGGGFLGLALGRRRHRD